MPHVRIETNQAISYENTEVLLNQMTDLIVRELRKPRDYVQVLIGSPCQMLFAGTAGPTALVVVRSVGLPPAKPKALSAGICAILEETLDIPPSRVFINFFDIPRGHWGWNGTTFG